MDTLFSHVSVLTMDERMSVWLDAFVGVTDGKIAYLGKKAPEEQPEHIVDASGMVLMPGLINCHTHLPLSLLRGYGDELAQDEWLRRSVFPRQARMDARSVKAAALHERWHGFDNGRIKIDCAIHSYDTSTHPAWEAVSGYALENGLGMQLHLSETAAAEEDCLDRTGLTQAQLLDCHRLFAAPAAAAHCCHLSEEDMRLLARRGVSAVHCPRSELRLGMGRADVLAMVKAGMNVCLGTESAAASGSLDVFSEMRTAALMAKAAAGRVDALPPEAALMMATVCGARAQGRAAECGMIKTGMDADLILLDFNQPHLIPCHNMLTDLVYTVCGQDVALTMVRGKVLYAAGKYASIDLDAVMQELRDYAIPTIFSDAKADGPDTEEDAQ